MPELKIFNTDKAKVILIQSILLIDPDCDDYLQAIEILENALAELHQEFKEVA